MTLTKMVPTGRGDLKLCNALVIYDILLERAAGTVQALMLLVDVMNPTSLFLSREELRFIMSLL